MIEAIGAAVVEVSSDDLPEEVDGCISRFG